MADIVLIQPRTDDHDMVYAPLGILALAGTLERHFSVQIVDTRIESDPKSSVLAAVKSRPILVGVSSITGRQIKFGVEISGWVRETAPEVPIVWGGVHPTFFPEETLAHPLVDYVVMNEGEETLLELARHLAEGAPDVDAIAGICHKKNGTFIRNPERPPADLNAMPAPAWRLVDVARYVNGLSSEYADRPIDVCTSRGCPFRCEFCYEIAWSNRTWRGRHAEFVIDEIRMLSDRFGINHIIFHDDLFIINNRTRGRALDIARGMNAGGRRIRWTMTYRVDQLCADPDYVSRLVEHGFYEMRAGVESGSDRVLKSIKKDLTVDQILRSAQISRERGFRIRYSFVIGWPGETEEDRQKTIDLCFRLFEINPEIRIYPLWIYVPYPGTPLFNHAVERGFQKPTSLEAWGEYTWGKVRIPWIENSSHFENIHTLSKFAFFNRDSAEVLRGLLKKEIRFRAKVRRLGALGMRAWARYRLKNASRFMPVPYEYRVIEPLLAGRA